MDFERILFPVDFSEHSERCLERTSKLFADNRTRQAHFLYVLHTPVDFSEWSGDPMADVEERLKELIGKSHLEGFSETKSSVGCGHASTEICKYATKHQCDLIVMPTHGRTGLAHMLLGSTAEQVVRHAPCPVLTLRVKLS